MTLQSEIPLPSARDAVRLDDTPRHDFPKNGQRALIANLSFALALFALSAIVIMPDPLFVLGVTPLAALGLLGIYDEIMRP